MKPKELVTTTIMIPISLRKELQEYRQVTGHSMATVARLAFRDFLDAQRLKTRLTEEA